jgi:serine/threonine-protein kinase
MHRYLLPDEVKEDLARYSGPLLLATDDPTLPWELLYDGEQFLGLRQAVGRRLVVSRRRRNDEASARPAATGGALLIGNPTSDLFDAERETDLIADLLAPVGPCTVLKGPQARKAAVLQALASGEYRVVHFVGQIQSDPSDLAGTCLVLADRELLTAAEIERTLAGEPFVFLNACHPPQAQPTFLGSQVDALAAALAAGGARGFVGTAWPVYDAGSRQVPVEFYRRVVEAVPVGEALRQARSTVRVRRGDEPSWSAHVLYGDPNLLVLPLSGGTVVTLRPRQRFGPFVLEQEIGRGGMGVVWKAYQPSLDRYVALKFLPAIHGEIAQSRERFRREARVVARLRHPNVLQVHDFGEEQGHLFLVTEYVPGGTLQDLLRREERLTVGRALGLLEPVAAALDHLHAQQVIHRDVKPSNILLDQEGAPVLADCGVARLLDDTSTMTMTGAVVGTPAYMSPEQASGQDASPASDQYSFAVMMFEALTGRPPFEGKTPVATAFAHLQQPPPSPRSLNPHLSPAVETALLRGLAKRPEERYPSLQAFVQAIRSGDQETGLPAAVGSLAAQSTTRQLDQRAGLAASLADDQPSAEWSAAAAQQMTHGVAGAPPTERRSAPLIPALIVGLALLAAGGLTAHRLGFLGDPAPTAAPATAVAAAPTSAPVAPAVSGPAAAPTTLPTAPPAPTSPPTPTTAPPTATPLPRALADWNALLAKLDGGLWGSDLPGAGKELEAYLERYQAEKPPQFALASDKLYAASIELGRRGVAAGDFGAALDRFTRANQLKPDDALAQGELKKVQLLSAGDAAVAGQRWEEAVERYEALAAIDAGYGGADQKLQEARSQLAATWTPTPQPAPPPPAAKPQQQQVPASKPQQAPASKPQPAPAPAQPAPRPAPAAAPTKAPFVPGTN